MKKLAFSICEVHISCVVTAYSADDRLLYFCYIDSTNPLLLKLKISIFQPSAWFMSDIVRNLEDRSSHNTAHILFLSDCGIGMCQKMVKKSQRKIKLWSLLMVTWKIMS